MRRQPCKDRNRMSTVTGHILSVYVCIIKFAVPWCARSKTLKFQNQATAAGQKGSN